VSHFWSFCLRFATSDPCTSLWMVYPRFMCINICTINLRVTPRDSPMLSTNFSMDQTFYFRGIQHIVWLVPKYFQSPCRPAESRRQILQCFQQIFQLINQYTSMAFNKLSGWFQNIFRSLCQATSRAFNSSSIPTANSIEKGGNGSN
jgi:hypothetical protein